MGQITSLFVHKVIAQADDSLDKRAFLEGVGVDPDAPVDPKVMVAGTMAATSSVHGPFGLGSDRFLYGENTARYLRFTSN